MSNNKYSKRASKDELDEALEKNAAAAHRSGGGK